MHLLIKFLVISQDLAKKHSMQVEKNCTNQFPKFQIHPKVGNFWQDDLLFLHFKHSAG